MVNSKGWKRFASKWKSSAEETGKFAIRNLIKPEVLQEKITRANQALTMIEEVELLASRKDELYEKFREIKNIK